MHIHPGSYHRKGNVDRTHKLIRVGQERLPSWWLPQHSYEQFCNKWLFAQLQGKVLRTTPNQKRRLEPNSLGKLVQAQEFVEDSSLKVQRESRSISELGKGTTLETSKPMGRQQWEQRQGAPGSCPVESQFLTFTWFFRLKVLLILFSYCWGHWGTGKFKKFSRESGMETRHLIPPLKWQRQVGSSPASA